MKILLGDFNANVGREDIFKPAIGNKNVHEIGNGNEFRAVNLRHPKLRLSKVQYSHMGHLLMETRSD
jgi:hypothetical protein